MKKKKFLSILLSALLVLCLTAGSAALVFGEEADLKDQEDVIEQQIEDEGESEEEMDSSEDIEEYSDESDSEEPEESTDKKESKDKKNDSKDDEKSETISGEFGTVTWTIDEDGNLVVKPSDGKSGQLDSIEYTDEDDNNIPWYEYIDSINTAAFKSGIKAGKSLSHLFADCTELTSCTFDDSFDTSATTDMTSMFDGCVSLNDLDISALNATKVVKASGLLNNVGKDSETGIKISFGKNFFNMEKSQLKKVNLSGYNKWDYTVLEDDDDEDLPSGECFEDLLVPLDELEGDVVLVSTTKVETEDGTVNVRVGSDPDLDILDDDDSEEESTTKSLYNVVIYLNGGSLKNSPKASSYKIKVKNGATISDEQFYKFLSNLENPPSTETAEYYYSGLYYDEECTNEFDYDTAITEDTEVYVGWYTDVYHFLYLDSRGGEPAHTYQLLAEYEVTEEPEEPTKSGYVFKGWYYDQKYTQKFKFGNTISYDTTIYAKWVKTYTVTFESNGGSSVTSETVEKGSKATKPTNPTKSGATFDKWYTDAACKKAYDFKKKVTKNITLYAGWIPDHTVTYYLNGGYVGSAPVSTTGTTTVGTAGVYTVTIPDSLTNISNFTVASGGSATLDPSSTGLTASTAASNIANGLNSNTLSRYSVQASGTTLTFTEKYSYYGTAGAPSCSIIANGATTTLTPTTVRAGTASSGTNTNSYSNTSTSTLYTQNVAHGATTTAPTVTRTNYTFGGWYLNSQYTGDPFDFKTPITKDTVLYAKWTINNGVTPSTGDNSNMTIWIVVIIAVVCAAAVSIVVYKKKQR